MAKGKKITKKDIKEKNKISEEENKILEELANSLKKRLGNEKDEAELEDNESTELDFRNFDNLDFSSFEERDSSPILERIAGRQMNPIFVGGIPASSSADLSEEKNTEDFKYTPGQSSANEPKYLDSDSHLRGGAERVDFEKVGRNFEPWRDINQEAMFMRSSEARGESSGPERIFTAERFDEQKERKKRWDDDRGKYEPNLPKSR